MGMTEDEKNAKLKEKLADIIRDKGWNKNKTYDSAMWGLFKTKAHPYGSAHWDGAMKLVFSAK